MEGGLGADAIDGGGGQDDVIGGLSPTALAPTETTASFNDVGDLMVAGGDGADVLVGDNAAITHPLGTDGRWGRSLGDASYLRTVVLLDRLTIGGDDILVGDAGNDRMWAARGDDTLYGSVDADTLEGGQGNDLLSGGSGADDLIGGTSPDAIGGKPADAESAAASTPDGNDLVYEPRAPHGPERHPHRHQRPVGGAVLDISIRYGPLVAPPAGQADDDVVFGDNARIDRCAPDLLKVPTSWKGRDVCAWGTETIVAYGPATRRFVQALGESVAWILFPTGRAGNDTLYGNAGDDLLFGQDGNDYANGGGGDDIVAGGLLGTNEESTAVPASTWSPAVSTGRP